MRLLSNGRFFLGFVMFSYKNRDIRGVLMIDEWKIRVVLLSIEVSRVNGLVFVLVGGFFIILVRIKFIVDYFGFLILVLFFSFWGVRVDNICCLIMLLVIFSICLGM